MAALPACIRELGLPTGLIRSKTMQCTPRRHRDVHVGTFFLGEKDGDQPLTPADEELLVLFVAQAAPVMSDYLLERTREKVTGRESESAERRERLPRNPFRQPEERPELQRLFQREAAVPSR